MHDLLKIGQIVNIDSINASCEVKMFLGGGGQGEVYQVDIGGKLMALKWYFPHMLESDTHQESRLKAAIERGTPSDRFLWPIDLASDGNGGWGYIMPLRPPQYKSLIDLMKRRIQPTFKSLITAGFQLADSFLQLHSKGLSYCDISFGNVFFNPSNGDILICDNDNVTISGNEIAIAGTPRFMAPEIVMGKAKPDANTDLYSLAVLLFYILFTHHPLEGRKETQIRILDLPAMNQLYGSDVLFIFDPNDRSNEPVAGFHDNALIFWDIYPKFILDLFIDAFTKGIKNERVRESQWRQAMVELRDSILYCPHCGEENFYDVAALKSNGKLKPCWNCQKEIQLPPRIRIEKSTIMLNSDTKLYPHHVGINLFDFSQPIAEVSQHPTNPNLWGIKNLGREKWDFTTAKGELKEVQPGRSVPMAQGTKINFGRASGEIRA